MKKYNNIKLLLSLFFTVGLGLLSGLFTVPEIGTWYVKLNKPSFNPPNYLFGPVWLLLYTFMGISFYLIWIKPASQVRTAGVLFFLFQFVLNIFWSFIFFKLHNLGWAFAEIILMWLLILFTINEFRKLSSTAAWLLVPYILWVGFAAVLNFSIWRLN
ncbi:MAG: tryptophan-rich sensory protein [Chitinophagaceae bacterium]|nr:tryptophan-rich sensory protein [Chitinophagaceae bacterium]